jgi:hypothetical protein
MKTSELLVEAVPIGGYGRSKTLPEVPDCGWEAAALTETSRNAHPAMTTTWVPLSDPSASCRVMDNISA